MNGWPQVRAWFSTTANLQDDANRRCELRSQGFRAALARISYVIKAD
jgi:hypothetical protein